MIPWGWTAVAAVVGFLIGMPIQRRLATLSYRWEDERDLPKPTSPWWVPIATSLGAALLVARFGEAESWPWLLPLLPIAILGPWLAAIDLDVQRLPNKLLLPLAAAIALGVSIAAIVTDDALLALRGLVGGVGMLAFLWTLYVASRAGFGFGDVKLAAALSVATTAMGLTTLWWSLAIAAGSAAAFVVVTRRRGDLAYGPWLITGALMAALF